MGGRKGGIERGPIAEVLQWEGGSVESRDRWFVIFFSPAREKNGGTPTSTLIDISPSILFFYLFFRSCRFFSFSFVFHFFFLRCAFFLCACSTVAQRVANYMEKRRAERGERKKGRDLEGKAGEGGKGKEMEER